MWLVHRRQGNPAYATDIGEFGSAASGRQGMACLPSDGEPARRLSARPGQPGRSGPGSGRGGPSAPPRGFRSRFLGRARAGRPWRVARYALAALALLVASSVAQAQTSVKLVSNTGQHRAAGGKLNFDFAQSFSTGGRVGGYKLTRVDVMMRHTSPAPVYTVSIHDDSSGLPGSSLGTLAKPSTLSATYSLHQFTASGDGIDLAANTSYWLVVDVSSASATSLIAITQSDAEDPVSVPAWSIGDGTRARSFSNTSWNLDPTYSLQIAVHGTGGDSTTASGATVDGSTLTLTYDQELDTTATPAATRFTVAGTDTATTVTAVEFKSGGPNSVDLTLSWPVSPGDTGITLSYAQGSDPNPLKDTIGTTMADFADLEVTNNTRPEVVGASVDGSTLTVTFGHDLDDGSAPAGSAFTVGAAPHGELARTISGTGAATIAGKTVTVTLASPVEHGETVTIGYARPASNPLQNRFGQRMLTFAGFAATNNTPDGTPPALSGAAVSGAALTLTFDEDLADATNLASGAFTVQKTPWAGFAEAVSLTGSPAISGRTLTLALAEAVESTDINVRVSYAKPASGNTLQDAAGNEVAGFSDRPVANALDTTAPTFHGAAVHGAALTLTFDEDLGEGAPAGRAFIVSATPQGGAARTILGTGTAAIADDRATVTLAEAVAAGATVTVSYVKPSGNPLEDTAGNGLADFTDQPVTNVTGDTTAPKFEGGTVNGARVVLVFGEPLDAGSVPEPTRFTPTLTSGSRGVADGGVDVDGRSVTLILAEALAAGDELAVQYIRPVSTPLQDLAGNTMGNFSARTFDILDVTGDATPPAYSGLMLDGTTLTVAFDEDLAVGAVPALAAFAVTAGGSERTLAGVAVAGAEVRLTLARAVTPGQSVSVSYVKPASRALQDLAGNTAAAFRAGLDATGGDMTPPAFAWAAAGGTTLTVGFNEALDPGSAPAGSAFSVSATPQGGAARPIAGEETAAIAGGTATVSLASAVAAGEAVTVSYTEPESNPLRDAAENEVADFTGQAATNNTGGDATAPSVLRAAVSGTTLTLAFDESLDAGSVPAGSAFQVSATPSGGTAREIYGTGAAIAGDTATVTLAEAVAHGETVTASYTKQPNSNPLRDGAENEVADFAGRAVTNDTPAADTTAPAFLRAAANAATLTVRFDEALDTGSAPEGSAFTLSATAPGGAARSIAGTGTAAIAGDTARVTLAEAVAHGETVTVSYTRPAANPLRDAAGNDVNSLPLPGQSVTNRTPDTTPPAFLSATVNALTLAVTFDESLDAGSAAAGGAFTLSAAAPGGTARSIAGTGAAAIAAATATVSLAEAVADGETVTVSYTRPAANPLQDAVGNDVETFLSGQAVTNQTPDTTAPAFLSATVNAATLAVTFDRNLDSGSLPDGSRFAASVGPPGGTARSVAGTGTAAIDGATATVTLAEAVAHGETVTVSYTGPATGNPLKSAAGYIAGSFSGRNVTNMTPDTTGPRVLSATVNGATLTLLFDEALDPGAKPPSNRVSVTLSTPPSTTFRGGTVTALSITGRQLFVTLDSPVTAADLADVAYSPQGVAAANRLQDAAGNQAAGFTETAANITGDETPPAFSTAEVNETTLTVTFDETLDAVSPPAGSAFTVSARPRGGAARSIAGTGVSTISGRAVTVTLASRVVSGEAVTVVYTQPANDPVHDRAGNLAATFRSPRGVQNGTPPVLSQMTVDSKTLRVTFDADLDPLVKPAGSAFEAQVTSGGTTSQAPGTGTVKVDGATATVALRSAAAVGDAVEVSYLAPSSMALADSNGNEVADFSGRATNITKRPAFSSATVNGKTLRVTFDKSLDPAFAPVGSVFTVRARDGGGTTRSIAGTGTAAIDGATVTLTLAAAVDAGEAAEVQYGGTGSNRLRDAFGNNVAIFPYEAVANKTAELPPELVSATVNRTTLSVTFDEDLDTGSAPAGSSFAVSATRSVGAARRIAGTGTAAIDGATATVTLASRVFPDDTVTLVYTQPASDALQDGFANEVETFPSPAGVENQTPTAFSHAAVNGDRLVVIFDGPIADGSSLTSRFAVNPRPGTTDPDHYGALSGALFSGPAVTVTLDKAIHASWSPGISFSQATGSVLRDAQGRAVSGFSNKPLRNVAGDTTAPALVGSLTVNGAALRLVFDGDMHPGMVAGSYSAEVQGEDWTPIAITDALIVGRKVTLALASPVAAKSVLRFAYAPCYAKAVMSGLSNSEMSAFGWKRIRGCGNRERRIEHQGGGSVGRCPSGHRQAPEAA